MATLIVADPNEYIDHFWKATFPNDLFTYVTNGKSALGEVRKKNEFSAIVSGWTEINDKDDLIQAVQEAKIPWYVITGAVDPEVLSEIYGLGATVLNKINDPVPTWPGREGFDPSLRNR